jgi:hypothetical protein
MIEAREEADVEDVPGEECSARMVVWWAIQVLFLFVSLWSIEGYGFRSCV